MRGIIRSDPVLEQLDRAVSGPKVSAQLAAILSRVSATLQTGHDVMAWETVALSVFDGALPPSIASCWVFVIRAGAETGAERHPNSHQRSLSLAGGGEFQLRPKRTWERHPLTSAPDEPIEHRWVSIPVNTWHRWLAGGEPWGILSFHTVAADELIEETPVDPTQLDGGPTRQNLYAGVRK